MIDLRSDTVTRPDAAMRDAARDASVGDDVYGEDPSVNELERRTSELLGTDAALFCPSGTMANQIAIDVWTEHGQELILERQSHIFRYEVGGAARHAGLQTHPIDGTPRGSIDANAVETAIRTPSLHVAGTGLLALENTHNNRGGRALSVEEIAEPAAVARRHDVPVHLDGARLWNAAIAHGVEPDRYVAEVDSAMVSLSKGLGAPVGSMLAGDASFIERARRSRKAFGGGMRQAGIVAAPALIALDRRDALDRDHRLATRLAAGIGELDGVQVTDPETNIVLVEIEPSLTSGTQLLEACEDHGVLGTEVGGQLVRFVTHRDVDRSAIDDAIEHVRAAHDTIA